MTDKPGGVMMRIKIRRDPVTGLRALDSNDPVAGMILGLLKASGTDILNPHEPVSELPVAEPEEKG